MISNGKELITREDLSYILNNDEIDKILLDKESLNYDEFKEVLDNISEYPYFEYEKFLENETQSFSDELLKKYLSEDFFLRSIANSDKIMTKDDETKQNLIKMINSTLNNLYDNNNTETFEENNVIDNLIDQLILAMNHMEDNKGYVQIEDFDFDSFKAFYRESIKNIKKMIQIKLK